MRRIEITDKGYDWLIHTVRRVHERLQANPTHYELADIELINELFTALERGDKYFEATEAPEFRAKQAKLKAQIVQLKSGCIYHPNYQAKRRPRTDCKACWAAFKAYNPTAYTVARQDYERKQNRAQ